MKKITSSKDDPASTGLTKSGGRAINYSRWLSDLYPQIENMPWFNAAFPSSHNAGADMKAIGPIADKWAACQDNSFYHQLMAGARILDLRLKDTSYKKTTGNHNPVTKTYYRFEFQHGGFGNRRLEDLIGDLQAFFRQSPGELVVLDLHHYDKGGIFAYSSLPRLLTHLKVLEVFALPATAANYTWKEVKASGRNLVISGNFSALPVSWQGGWLSRVYLWNSIPHAWNPDSSQRGVEELVTQTMLNPPMRSLTSLSAAVYAGGPRHLLRNNPIRLKTFESGLKNASIVNVDFIERPDTRVSVVDKCIELTLQRAQDKTPPSAPRNFTVERVSLYEADKVNTVRFAWGRASDNLGVRSYQIFKDNKLIFVVSGSSYTAKGLPKWNGIFKVVAIDGNGNISQSSNEVGFNQDTIPPSIPKNLRFSLYGLPTVRLQWDASSDGDGIGVKGYHVRMNGVVQGFTAGLFLNIQGVPPSESRFFEVCSEDKNGNISEWTGITRPVIPNLQNMKVCYLPLDLNPPNPDLARAIVTWDPIQDPGFAMPFALAVTSNNVVLPPLLYNYGEQLTFLEYVRQGQGFDIKISIKLMDTGEETKPETIRIDVNLTLPEPAKNFRIVSETPEVVNLSWVKSVSRNIVSYALSVDGNPPVLIPGSSTSYALKKWDLQKYLIELWAIDEWQNPSIVESVIINSPPPIPKILFPANGSTVFTLKPVITGEYGIRGGKIHFYEKNSGIELGTADVNDVGLWSEALKVSLSPGPVTLRCKQFLNGQQSGYSETVTFTVDIDIPVPKILSPANGSTVTTFTPLISGNNGIPGAKIIYYYVNIPFLQIGEAYVGEKGEWSAATLFHLQNGYNSLTCRQYFNGQESERAEAVTFTVDAH